MKMLTFFTIERTFHATRIVLHVEPLKRRVSATLTVNRRIVWTSDPSSWRMKHFVEAIGYNPFARALKTA
jgi:hypothetical protein